MNKLSIVIINVASLTLFFYTSTLLFLLIWRFFISNYFYLIFRDNKKVDDLVKEAVDFYIKELDLNSSSVAINTKTLFPQRVGFICGYVEKYRAQELIGKYSITIHLNHSIFSIVSTIAHEMIHVEQWEKGHLVEFGTKRMWKGDDHTLTKYEDRPWEIEAFKREKGLSEKFLKHKKIKKSFLRILIELVLPI